MRCALFLFVSFYVQLICAQKPDSIQLALLQSDWFRYWEGMPMTHGSNGSCIAGYSNVDKQIRFLEGSVAVKRSFHDNPFGMPTTFWKKNLCEDWKPGYEVYLLTGTWSVHGDSIHVSYNRAYIYDIDEYLNCSYYKDRDTDYKCNVKPLKTCRVKKEEVYVFLDGKLCADPEGTECYK